MHRNNSKFTRRLTVATALLISFLTSALLVSASVISFDADGLAPTNTTQQVATFDFLPGNSLFKGIGDLTQDGTNRQFVQYIQSRLGQLKRQNSQVINTRGLNGVPAIDPEFEITIVAGFSAKMNISGGVGTYAYNPSASSPVNFFELWYDDITGGGTNADDLTGIGFADGIKILSGTLTMATGVVSVYDYSPSLDNFNNDDYPGVGTLQVVGGEQLSIHVDYANPAFFTSQLPPNLKVELFNQSTVTPFDQVDPSALFWNGLSNFAHNIGATNGLGADFQVQSDANSSFTVVPEPSSMILAGLGASLFSLAIWRRKKTA